MPEIDGFSAPDGLVESLILNCPQPTDEDVLIELYRAYMDVLKGRQFHFTGPDPQTGEVREITVSAASASRYFEEGRAKMKRKLAKRLGHGRTRCVLLTLTVDPKRYSKLEAWETVWSEYAAFRRQLWKHLKKRD